ncbi:MAG: hypothetical protein CM1200mP30_09690 [Pseudomonadota bacterium]|nr:MAG: hypothetical protein CM1200mP30_09690 [Pseudomonadota bacterium]
MRYFTSTLVQLCIGLEQVLSIFAITERWKKSMLLLGVSPLRHFSHQELAEYSSVPEPAVHLTCESIRQETFFGY